METKRRALMMVNRGARRGGDALALVPRLKEHGLAVTVEDFDSPAELSRDIVRLGRHADLAIICGGDGTMAAAAKGLLETKLPLGILPLGTANDLARTLGIPDDLHAACAVIARGRSRRIDVGFVNDKAFFNVASLGLSAKLAAGLTGEEKRRWGQLAYTRQALRVLATARPFDAEIESCHGTEHVRTLQIAVGNGRHYGGGQVVEAEARIDDGHLDLYSLPPAAVWKLALRFDDFKHGRHGAWSEVTTAKSTDFWIRTRKPMPINTDGELLTETPAHFLVHADAIEVLVP